ncbi:MAG: glutamine--fructose-6-phosphate transaminase (isomerizing), partial [Proteobacteria bacterium]|nr:glutamine--fructose-6-phosphate transaminase (isomerizing) [Pseudomonadota bacterium]
MCGIYCSISDGDVRRPVLDGLQRLEYRGYDSAGVAWMSDDRLRVIKSVGRIQRLVTRVSQEDISARLMLGHTRWATHGKCTEENAHPHISNGELALVHNGIIENYLELEVELQSLGYTFVSSTDTEVLAHLLHHCLESQPDPQRAIEDCLKRIEGNYAFVVCFRSEPQRLFGVCSGSPLVVGLDKDSLYLSSDIAALTPVTSQVIYLEDGNVFVGNLREYGLFDFEGGVLEARITETKLSKQILDLGVYHNYTEKEIFEQPQAAIDTIKARVTDDGIVDDLCGVGSDARLREIEEVHIVGCGSSYHAGLVAQHWFEDVARVPCRVDIASEFTSRPVVGRGRRLLLLVSQSGETADTINALRAAGAAGYFMTMCIVNVANSALTRLCEFSLHTHAGHEVGVATTKALTTQMICLLMLATRMAQLGLDSGVGVGGDG